MEYKGIKYKIEDTYNNLITIPDSWVITSNKLGSGHGEAKLYIGQKKANTILFEKSKNIRCLIMKSDLLQYMDDCESEYLDPKLEYKEKDKLPSLYSDRIKKIKALEDLNDFIVDSQDQIQGSRGYINSNDNLYQLIREISLPLFSYLSVMKLVDESNPDNILYYWKLFVDYVELFDKERKDALVFKYGNSRFRNKKSGARKGQNIYRERLLAECDNKCAITGTDDPNLLIASHIKPYYLSRGKEKIDPSNGIILSPLYDKLFDRGLITFTDDKEMELSSWLSPANCKRLNLHNGTKADFPLTDKRKQYLEYHRKKIYKGNI